ncbi:hypothetical protein [Enterococcus columbae]|uniref:Immunity protein n=1 Tax=Enterococcus columbae DSM 7374 = ATCC 51263 TaxID=1121865 RepID=S1NUC0_9ENTE|nr:hypothetical protein [Enterococcus columbae]EOT38119.1 hypothetical protein OMW_02377 [Enterococcus columbae DSM 7374 = ATCC 51263]EOW83786.1 hypothetical protein I568_01588 [Enterococcus columbae DSM 7374 = ATCC 51263]
MLETLVGLVLVILGGYEFYAVLKAFKYTKKHGNKNTSPFLPLGLYSGTVFGLTLVGFGVSLIFHLI